MGSIQTSLQLYDGVSSTLQRITGAVAKTTQGFEVMDNRFDTVFDGDSFDGAQKGLNTINVIIGKIENNVSNCNNTFNQMETQVREAEAQQQKFNNSLNSGVSAGNNLLGKLKTIVATYLGLQAGKNTLGASDQLTLTTARLNLMNDGLQTTAELSREIFESAERSRASYTDTAAAISKLGILAGKSFAGNDEIIAFTELMNKNFKVGGASATEQASAMYQLTQAMAAGKLQGDEYRSIIENAPLLASAIKDYMINVQKAKGTMKDWAADGLLTADVIKTAMFNSAEEIEDRFKSIPMTWSDIGTSIKNNALVAFEPVLKKINELANSEKFQSFKDNMITGLWSIATVAMNVLNIVVGIVNFISDNWPAIGPIIYGIAGALAVYHGWLLATTVAQGALTLAKMLAVPVYALLTGATMADTAAQWGLNAALYACPLVWIIILIIALIALIYFIIAIINKFAGTSLSATGIIAGAFMWLGALIGNIFIGALNGIIQALWTIFVEPIISIVEWVLNVFNGGFDSFGDAVKNLLGQIISWFLSLGKVVTKIIDAIFGTSWTDGLSDLQSNVLEWGKNENAITLERNAPEIDYRYDMTDAWDAGYNTGKELDNSISNMFSSDGTSGYSNSLDDVYNNIAQTADNTDKLVDSVNISDEDIKSLHDIAERDVINRFTTAEIKVDMTNYNNINGTGDIDGIVEYLSDVVEQQMSISAEGAI